MEPIKFKQHNVIFAKNQKEYLPLPAFEDEKQTITCWKLTFVERIKILFTGKFWLRQLNFNSALQPLSPSIDSPFIEQ